MQKGFQAPSQNGGVYEHITVLTTMYDNQLTINLWTKNAPLEEEYM